VQYNKPQKQVFYFSKWSTPLKQFISTNLDKKHTICICDNHAIFREGIKALLSTCPQFEVVAEGEDGRDVINAVKQNQPDIILLDLSMPKMNGLDAIKYLKSQYPKIKIIVLTLHDTEEYIHAALDAGANGYLLKDSCYKDLEQAILAVVKNQTPLSPAVSEKIINVYLNEVKPEIVKTPWESLTPREREHLKLIAESYSNKEISEYLCISIKTVEKHRANLMKKLGMHSATELTVYAVKKGLVNK